MPAPLSERRSSAPIRIQDGQEREIVDGREALLSRLRRVARGEDSTTSISPIELFEYQMISEANLVRQTVLLMHFLQDNGIGIRKNYYASLYEKLVQIIPTGIFRLVDRKKDSSKAIVLYRVYPPVGNVARKQIEDVVNEIKNPQPESTEWKPQAVSQEPENSDEASLSTYKGLTEEQKMVMRLHSMGIYERVIVEVLGKSKFAVRYIVRSSFDRIDPKREMRRRLHPPFNQWFAVVDYAKLRAFFLQTKGRLPTTTDIDRALQVGALHYSSWRYRNHFGQRSWPRAQEQLEHMAKDEAIQFIIKNIQMGIQRPLFQEHLQLIHRAQESGLFDSALTDHERYILRCHYRTDWARRSWEELRREFGYKNRQNAQEKAKYALRKLEVKLVEV